MFIEQAYKYLHESWRYLVGLVVIFIIWQLGSIPFSVAVSMKVLAEGGNLMEYLEDQTLLMKVLEPNTTFFLVLLSFAIGLLGLYLWVTLVHKQPMKALTTTRSKIDWSRFWFGFGLIGITTTVLTVVDYQMNPENYVFQFQWKPFLILAMIAIFMIPLQTSFEEYFFRGYLMQGFGVMSGNRWVPLVTTSIIFGSLHFFNPEVTKMGNIIMLYYIGTAFFLGIMTLMDEGMELALGFHAGNNLIASMLVTADWTAFQTNSILKDVSDPTAGFDVLVPIIFVYPLFLLLMARRYKWSGWQEKLTGKLVPPEVDTQTELEF